jgi:hypothetical protein
MNGYPCCPMNTSPCWGGIRFWVLGTDRQNLRMPVPGPKNTVFLTKRPKMAALTVNIWP